MRCHSWVLFSGLWLSAVCVHAQTASQPEIHLEPHTGKTTFQIGEPILLDLVISNPTATPMTVNDIDYGDNSDPVEVSPAVGWIAWQGQSNHDYGSVNRLGSVPVRIPVRVDQAVIFRQPGHYDVRVTEQRVQDASDFSHQRLYPKTVTNSVGIDLEQMPEPREAEIVRGVQSDLTNATNDRAGARLRRAAVTRLAALQGDIALEEKVKLLIAEQDDFRGVETEAWATTRDLPRQLELIQAAWRDPHVAPAYDMPRAMDETRLMIAGRPLSGWKMVGAPSKPDAIGKKLADAHQQDMLDLLHSMPSRKGENRRDAAYYLAEFGGLPEAEQARARDYAIDEFPHMNSIAQHMLLQTARPSFRDARLLPTLRSLLDHDPADAEALTAFLDLSPDEAMPYVVRAVCAQRGPPLIGTFAKVKDDRIPAVDACLASLLQGTLLNVAAGTSAAPVRDARTDIFTWTQRVVLAARFATPGLLPVIESSGAQQLQTHPDSSEATAALVTAEMRDKPKAAVMRLQRSPSSLYAWFQANQVFESAHRPFPPDVSEWLRTQVLDGSDDAAGQAAYELSIGGTAEDRSVIESRLAKFRLDASASSRENASMEEENLVAALFGGKTWKLTREEREAVTQGCLYDGCRRYAPH